MNILNFFRGYALVHDDDKNTITNLMQGVPTMKELQEKNVKKLEDAKNKMGELYILHKSHKLNFVKSV